MPDPQVQTPHPKLNIDRRKKIANPFYRLIFGWFHQKFQGNIELIEGNAKI